MTIAVTAANVVKTTIQKQSGWRSLIKPYIFSTFAIGTSVTTGDFICQYLERNKSNKVHNNTSATSISSYLPWWNRDRSQIMCTSAVLVTTPWSFALSRIVERLFPGKQGIQIAKKILTNSLVAPIGISLIFTSVTLLKGQSLRDAKTKVKTDLPRTYIAGACYWPFVSLINFRFVPLDYRPFLASIAGAIWNIYISSIANKTEENSRDSIESLRGATTVLIAETGGTGIPTLQETWHILDDSKKDL